MQTQKNPTCEIQVLERNTTNGFGQCYCIFPPKLIPSEKAQKKFSENKQLFQNCVLFPHMSHIRESSWIGKPVSISQLWWHANTEEPHLRNSGLRKEHYKRFWTMLLHRGVWNDDRYIVMKVDS
jgi:hypothetical protein